MRRRDASRRWAGASGALAALLLAAAILAGGGEGRAQEAAPGRTLEAFFSHRAAVSAPAGQLVRLALPAAVLRETRADLADLRVIDDAGREVPFLVDAGTRTDEERAVRATVRPELLGVERATTGRENAPSVQRETFRLSAPPAAPAEESWRLVIATGRARFVRRIEVRSPTGSAADAGSGAPLAVGSVFRLTDPPRERLALELPGRTALGESGALEVILEGEDDAPLEPTFVYQRGRTLAETERAEMPLRILSRRADGDATVLELERPGALVPDRLRLATTTPAFRRRVEVWDEGVGGGGRLGDAVLFRLPEPVAAAALELPLAAAHGDRLRIEIADGDSPPLAALAVHAVVRRPALVFALPGASATLYFGGGRVGRPEYDLAAAAAVVAGGAPASGAAGRVADRLLDPSALAAASLGQAGPNPRYDPAPALAFAMRPGAELDTRFYAWRRPLAARPSADGLVRHPLTPEDLARAAPDLADLRVVDGDSRQWAYLLAPAAGHERRSLAVVREQEEDGDSRYVVRPRPAPLAVDRLAIDPATGYFDRPFTLRGVRDGRQTTLASGRLRREAGAAGPVEIPFSAARVDELVLTITDGDDAPLELPRVSVEVPLPEVYFAAPAGEYALLLGHPEAEPPRYELERFRDLVLSVAAGEAEAGTLAENPAYRSSARWLARPGLEQIVLWAALGLAVVLLAGLTLRLARRDPEG